jgi:hypothetical protein
MWKQVLLAVLAVVCYNGHGMLKRVHAIGKEIPLSDGGHPFLQQRTTFGALGDADHRVATVNLGTVTDNCRTARGFTDKAKARFAASGFEDMAHLDAHTAVTCAGNLWAVFGSTFVTPQPDPDTNTTQCALLTAAAGGRLEVSELALLGLPDHADGKPITVHSHGLFVRGGMVYMINHAFERGGERVDAFTLNVAARTLTWYGGLHGAALEKHSGGLNDLVVTGDGELYATVCNVLPLNTTMGKLLQAPIMIFNLLFEREGTVVLRCEFTLTPGATTAPRCRSDALNSRYSLANGIATVAAAGEEFIAVVDSTGSKIKVHRRCGTRGDVCLIGAIPTVHVGDNIVPDIHRPPTVAGDAVTLHFTVGQMTSLIQAGQHAADINSPMMGGVSRVSITVLKQEALGITAWRLGEAVQADAAFHDGAALPGIATGLELRAAEDGSAVMVAGAYSAEGILVCPL